MRILVFSDSHHDIERCCDVINRIIGIDMIIHAGDHSEDAEKISRLFPDIPMYFVSGNCDFSGAPKELVFTASGKKIFLTHGHLYNVKNDLEFSSLLEHAQELGCDCAVFGHTHEGLCDVKGGITLLNPGSIRYGRIFGVIEIDSGKLRAAVCDA